MTSLRSDPDEMCHSPNQAWVHMWKRYWEPEPLPSSQFSGSI